MKYLFLLLLSTFAFSLALNSQDSFELVFENEGLEVGAETIELSQELYLTYGIIHEQTSNLSYPILIKYSDSLNFEYTMIPKQDTAYGFNYGILKENGNLLFLGALHNVNTNEKPNIIYLCEMSTDFELIWEKTYPIPEENYCLRMGDFLIDEDKNIVLSAGMEVDPYSTTYLYLAKFNMEGEKLAENFLPDYQVSIYNDIIPRPNGGGYILIGEVNKTLLGNWLEFDSNLNISTPWLSEPFGGEDWLAPPITAKWLSNGNLMLVNRGMGDQDAEFRVCNSDYTTLRDTLIFDPAIDYTPVRQGMDFVDEDLIWTATFNMYIFPVSFDKIFRVYVYDSEMNMLGMKTYGGDSQWWLEHLLATSDGGCIITGAEREANGTQWDDLNLYIIKIMPDDIFTAAEDTPMKNDRDVALYPNPVKDYLHIETARKNLNIQILDNLGRIVHQQKIVSLPHDKANLQSLTKGVYFYQILDDKRIIQNGKIVKQ